MFLLFALIMNSLWHMAICKLQLTKYINGASLSRAQFHMAAHKVLDLELTTD